MKQCEKSGEPCRNFNSSKQRGCKMSIKINISKSFFEFYLLYCCGSNCHHQIIIAFCARSWIRSSKSTLSVQPSLFCAAILTLLQLVQPALPHTFTTVLLQVVFVLFSFVLLPSTIAVIFPVFLKDILLISSHKFRVVQW